jgi:hypothetical protein
LLWLAENGWGFPYRDCKCEAIRDASDRAFLTKRGAWNGLIVMPWEWRATSQQSTEQPTIIEPSALQAPTACQIKGNISSKGERIYHVPGGKWYDATKIDESKGERWFCSDAEARAAGWRPAKQYMALQKVPHNQERATRPAPPARR